MTAHPHEPPTAAAPVLRVRNLSVALPRRADRPFAVRNVSLDLRRGEILCVVGESGSGKSVLSSAIMGHLPDALKVTAGEIWFENQDLLRLSQRQMRHVRGARIAMIFQEPMAALDPCMPVGRQIAEMFEAHTDLDPAAQRRRTLALLEDVHMPDPERILHAYPHQLSGGQCQRVIIAMALALEPAVLIADEPTTALDVTTQAQILRLIDELRHKHDNGILFITHDFGVVADIADRIAVMKDGELVELGEAAQVLNAPRHPYTRRLIDAVPDLVSRKTPRGPEARPALTVRSLEKVYHVPAKLDAPAKVVAAARNISFTLNRGETLGIVGESGSGKSTLARCVIRLINPDGGVVQLGPDDFTALQGTALRTARRRIQMIFQDPFGSLNPSHTVGHIIAAGPIRHGTSKAEAWRRAGELLELVGLKREALHRVPAQFSGGQRQRIAIARALALEPEVLIADEAVSALDVSVQKQVLALLDDLRRRLNLSMLFITHDLRVAAQVCHHIAVMHKGEMVEYGPARDIFDNPRHPYTRQLIDAAPGRDWSPPRLTAAE